MTEEYLGTMDTPHVQRRTNRNYPSILLTPEKGRSGEVIIKCVGVCARMCECVCVQGDSGASGQLPAPSIRLSMHTHLLSSRGRPGCKGVGAKKKSPSSKFTKEVVLDAAPPPQGTAAKPSSSPLHPFPQHTNERQPSTRKDKSLTAPRFLFLLTSRSDRFFCKLRKLLPTTTTSLCVLLF